MNISKALERTWTTHLLFAGLAVFLLGVNPAWAQAAADAGPDGMINRVGVALMKYVVLAVVIESALTPLFQWRKFQRISYRKGWKTPIAVVVSYIILSAYPELDAFHDVLAAAGAPLENPEAHTPGNLLTRILTAFLLAGGSAGFVKLYQTLGIRPPVKPDTDPEVTSQTTLHIRIDRGTVVTGPVTLQLDEGAAVTAGADDWLFRNVSPGRHLIRARALSAAAPTDGGTPEVVYVSDVADVNPAGQADFTIRF